MGRGGKKKKLSPRTQSSVLHAKKRRSAGVMSSVLSNPKDPLVVEKENGITRYLLSGALNREDGPAVIYPDGSEEWWSFGLLHREGGPALLFGKDKIEEAWVAIEDRRDKKRQEAEFMPGPEVFFDLSLDPVESLSEPYEYHSPVAEEWHKDGKLHREGGPARRFVNGTEEWWENGQRTKISVPSAEIESLYEDWVHYSTESDLFYDLDSFAQLYHQVFTGEIKQKDIDEHLETLKANLDSALPEFVIEAHLKDGKLHREDGPALLRAEYEIKDGKVLRNITSEWWVNGEKVKVQKKDVTITLKDNEYHSREDKPAVLFENGDATWYKEGALHREDGPAVLYVDGQEEWWLEGILHREDGPALVYPDGTKAWHIKGRPHREDGPAIIYPDGREEWWKDGRQIITPGSE